MCWYCENGLPEPVAKIFNELAEVHSNYEFGPGHIVFSDFNLDDHSIQWCLEHMNEFRHDLTDEEMNATRKAFLALLAIPEDVRVPQAARDHDE